MLVAALGDCCTLTAEGKPRVSEAAAIPRSTHPCSGSAFVEQGERLPCLPWHPHLCLGRHGLSWQPRLVALPRRVPTGAHRLTGVWGTSRWADSPCCGHAPGCPGAGKAVGCFVHGPFRAFLPWAWKSGKRSSSNLMQSCSGLGRITFVRAPVCVSCQPYFFDVPPAGFSLVTVQTFSGGLWVWQGKCF